MPKDDIHIVEQLIFTQKAVKADGVCGRNDIWEEPLPHAVVSSCGAFVMYNDDAEGDGE